MIKLFLCCQLICILLSSQLMAQVPMPEFSAQPGFYGDSVCLAISCPKNNAEIYYALDAATPKEKWQKYQGPILRNKSCQLMAVAILNGDTSAVNTATYFVGERRPKLPVVSLVTDPRNFFDDKYGIYVRGTNGKDTLGSYGPANWNQDWERPVHFEYFDSLGVLKVSLDAGVKISGGWSRREVFKPMTIVARKKYGNDRIRCKFFADKDITEFKSIMLRNGGTDIRNTMIRDAAVTDFVGHNMDIDYMACQPVVVYINGKYWGIHNLREKMGKHYFKQNYGIKPKNLQILEMNQYIVHGRADEYNDMLTFAKSHDLSSDSLYNIVARQIDINNLMDYWIAETFFGNHDWPGNNNRYWHTLDGKHPWRWVFFDLDYSVGFRDSLPSHNTLATSLNPKYKGFDVREWKCELMNCLLKNQGFREAFVQRYAYHISNTFDKDSILAYVDKYYQMYLPEWQYHAWRYPYMPYLEHWQANVKLMRNWIELRCMEIERLVSSAMKVGPANGVIFENHIPGAKFSINGCAPVDDFSGRYFKDIPLRIKVILPHKIHRITWSVRQKHKDYVSLSTEHEITIMPESETYISLGGK